MTNTQSVRLQTSGDRHWSSLAFGSGPTHSRGGILRLVVLDAAEGAWLYGRTVARGALALAGRASIGAGICGCSALHVGLRLDRSRPAGSLRSAAEVGRGRLLPLGANPT